MKVLTTILFVCVLTQTYSTQHEAIRIYERTKFAVQKNNLLVPKLLVGEKRGIPGATTQRSSATSVPKLTKVGAKGVSIYDYISAIRTYPMLMYIDPKLSGPTHINRFRAGRMEYKTQPYYFIQLVGDRTHSSYDSKAYWLAQGKFIDIPLNPVENVDPEIVFTPSFSGCSLVVDYMNDKTLRVYHVEGGKELEQYNNVRDHGEGMVYAMQYNDYGYFTVSNKDYYENVHGTAFMVYDRIRKNWQMHYHGIKYDDNYPSIHAISERFEVNAYFPKTATVVLSAYKELCERPQRDNQKIRIIQLGVCYTVTKKTFI